MSSARSQSDDSSRPPAAALPAAATLTDAARSIEAATTDDGAPVHLVGHSLGGLTALAVALDRPEHPDLSWIYLPHAKQGPANRVTYMSNYSPGNAPEGKTSFLVEITWPGREAFPARGYVDEVLGGLAAAGMGSGARASAGGGIASALASTA